MANGEQSACEIDIVVVEPHQCTDAHAGDRKPAEHGGVRVGAQPRGRGQVAGGLEEFGNLGITRERRRVTLWAIGQ